MQHQLRRAPQPEPEWQLAEIPDVRPPAGRGAPAKAAAPAAGNSAPPNPPPSGARPPAAAGRKSKNAVKGAALNKATQVAAGKSEKAAKAATYAHRAREAVKITQEASQALAGNMYAAAKLGARAAVAGWKNRRLLLPLLASALALCCCAPIMFVYFMFGGIGDKDGCKSSGAPGELTTIADGNYVWPLQEGTYGAIDPANGFRSSSRPEHQGQDFGVGQRTGVPIYAAAAGKVVAAGAASGFGFWIVIDSVSENGGKPFSTVYGHMPIGSFKVKANDVVRAGQRIADVGQEGQSDGLHLHFEVWVDGRIPNGKGHPINPLEWLEGRNSELPSKPAQKLPAGAPPNPAGRDVAVAATATSAVTSSAVPVSTQPGANMAAATSGPVAATSATTAAEAAADPNTAAGKNQDNCGFGVAGSYLKQGSIPGPHGKEFEKWIMASVIKRPASEWGKEFDPAKCPGITAPLIAGQLKTENNFVLTRVSPAGAKGPAQFLESTWQGWSADGDHDGNRDINSIADAVMAQAAFMCRLYEMAAEKVASGVYKRYEGSLEPPDPALDFALAAYNCCGENLGGLPPDPKNWRADETREYPQKVRQAAREFADSDGLTLGGGSGNIGELVVAYAREMVGRYPYSWGGGDTSGPTNGIQDSGFDDRTVYGFDCSGLVQYAVFKATKGQRDIGGTTYQQQPKGRPLRSINDAKPGDILFNDPKVSSHVGIYAGNGKMVHASSHQTGIIESAVGDNIYAYSYDLDKQAGEGEKAKDRKENKA